MTIRRLVDDARLDIHYARRSLLRNPGFSLVAILTMALGIGANTAIFSLLDAVLLRPLPFAHADRLVAVWENLSARGGPASAEATPADFYDWKEQNRAFEDLAAIDRLSLNLTGRGDPERVDGARVTGNLFALLELSPIAGRTLTHEDDATSANRVVVLSEGFWRRRFAGDRSIVGQSIRLDGLAHTVVGIVPDDFQFPSRRTDVWLPMSFTPEQRATRFAWYLYVVGRMKRDASLEQARADMTAIGHRVAERYPQSHAGVGITVVPLHEQYVGAARPLLMLLLGMVSVVLLVACVNVSHLLLARASARRREIVVRGALGAGRGRIVRQLLAESLVIGGAGAVTGSLLATIGFGFLTRLIPENFPERTTIVLNPTVLFFTTVVAVIASIAYGMGPAIAAARLNAHDLLKQAGIAGSRRWERATRGMLVIAEVAMTVVLLIAAALLARSFIKLRAVDVGFPSERLLIAETPLSPASYGDPQRRSEFVTRVVERLTSHPGVQSAGYINFFPLMFKFGRAGFQIEGRPTPGPGELPQQLAINRTVSAHYLDTLAVPLLRGRSFDDRDGAGAPAVTIINDIMRGTFWGNEDPLGRRIRFGPNAPWITIVGVVGAARYMGLDLPPEAEFYLPIEQTATPGEVGMFSWPRYLVVRTTGDPVRLASAVRQAVAEVDSNQPVANLRTMEDIIDQELGGRRTQLTLAGGFSLLALLLASVGLYGVLAYTVARQTPEIGLRMALGASVSLIVAVLIRRTLLLVGVGIVAGIAMAAAATRTLSSLLYDVDPVDPLSFGAVAVLVVAVSLVASMVPARRAARIQPLAALRSE